MTDWPGSAEYLAIVDKAVPDLDDDARAILAVLAAHADEHGQVVLVDDGEDIVVRAPNRAERRRARRRRP